MANIVLFGNVQGHDDLEKAEDTERQSENVYISNMVCKKQGSRNERPKCMTL